MLRGVSSAAWEGEGRDAPGYRQVDLLDRDVEIQCDGWDAGKVDVG